MDNVKDKIRNVFALWQRENCPGGQVLVRHKNEIIFEECFGYADIERKVKVDSDTIFHVASVSKQFTCMSIMILKERGLIDIDKDIREYIPDLIAFKEPITVRNMMNNISGIRDQWMLQIYGGVRMGDIITQEDLKNLNKLQRDINFPPMSQYLYSNTNFLFLAEMVLRITGQTLNEFATENIFKPLKMDKTFIREIYDDLVENRALSYVDTGNDSYKWKPLNYSSNGATSLHTTVRDFMKWFDNFENPTICTKQTIEEMTKIPALTTSNKTNYGFGLMIEEKGGHRSVGHGGADAGYRSHVLHFPEDELDIAIFGNVENIPMSGAAFKIADIVLGIDTSPKCDKLCDAPVKPVYGDFCIKELGGKVTIYEENGKDYISFANKKMPLIHQGGNKYSLSYFSDNIFFTENGAYYEMLGNCNLLSPAHKAVFDNGKEIEGLYYSDEVEAFYKIIACGNGLKIYHKRYGTWDIYKVDDETYICPMEQTLMFGFIKDEGGNVKGIRLKNGRVLQLDFLKVDVNVSFV